MDHKEPINIEKRTAQGKGIVGCLNEWISPIVFYVKFQNSWLLANAVSLSNYAHDIARKTHLKLYYHSSIGIQWANNGCNKQVSCEVVSYYFLTKSAIFQGLFGAYKSNWVQQHLNWNCCNSSAVAKNIIGLVAGTWEPQMHLQLSGCTMLKEVW